MSSGSPAVSTGDEVLVTLAGDPQAFRPTVTGGLAFSTHNDNVIHYITTCQGKSARSGKINSSRFHPVFFTRPRSPCATSSR
jgi:hypothetical protein